MGFTITINLDEECEKIWKKDFNKYSQRFSKYVCDLMKENYKQNMDIKERKKYIQDQEKDLKQKAELIKIEKSKLYEEQKTEKKEIKIAEKTTEEIDKKKLEKEKVFKKTFFEQIEFYDFNKKEAKKLYEEFKKQDSFQITFINEKAKIKKIKNEGLQNLPKKEEKNK